MKQVWYVFGYDTLVLWPDEVMFEYINILEANFITILSADINNILKYFNKHKV